LLSVGKRKKEKKRKMNKRYLPVIAAVLIAITCTAFVPVFATEVPELPTAIFSAPTLSVVTIAQDDQVRETGVILFSDTMTNYKAGGNMIGEGVPDLMAQFKILVSYNGLPVVPSSLYCQVVEKDKYNAIKDKQGPWENLETVPKEMSASFICKFRWGKPGVGVLDVYYVGAGLPVNIADYILFVGADYAVGRSTVFGTDTQDICALGWPMLPTDPASSATLPDWKITKPDGTFHYIYADPMFGWKSCEDLAMYQHDLLGVPIPWN